MNSVGSFSPLDTVWVTGPGGFSAVCTGCNLGEECLPMNIYYNGYPGFHFSNWYTIPEITLNMKVRRGTSVSTSTKEVTLIEGQITPVELNF